MKFLEYHRSKIHNDKREACTRVPHARLDAVPRLVAAPYMTSDNACYVPHGAVAGTPDRLSARIPQ